MKIKYLLFFISPFILFNCNPIIFDLTPKGFFPLAIGNKWYYKTTPSIDSNRFNETLAVIAQKQIKGNTYFETVHNIISANFSDTIYYRVSKNVLYSIEPPQSEKIIADFSLKLNDAAYWDSTGRISVSAKTDSIITFSEPFGGDYGSSITYKKGIGIIETYTNGFVPYQSKLVDWVIK